MYTLGSYVIEKYANMPYTSFAEERIFAPLNMSSTTFSPTKAASIGKLTQAWSKSGRLLPFWFTEEVVPLMAGAGGIISSAEDMVCVLYLQRPQMLKLL